MLSLVIVSPILTAFHSCCLSHQIRRTNNWIYKTKKSNRDRPSGPVAQWIEALSHYGSRWALSEDSGFNSYSIGLLGQKIWCDRQQIWKAVITGDTVTRLSIPIPRSQLITWRKPEVKFGWNVVRKTTKNLPRWGQKVRIKSIPNKDNKYQAVRKISLS